MPWPPAAWSARLASKRAWYSGVSGGCCAGPQPLLGSNTLPRPRASTAGLVLGPRRHWPCRSGYFVWSNAEAAAMVASSTDATIEIRSSITVLPAIDISHAMRTIDRAAARRHGTGVVCPVLNHAKTMYHTSAIVLPGGVSKSSTRTGAEHEAPQLDT